MDQDFAKQLLDEIAAFETQTKARCDKLVAMVQEGFAKQQQANQDIKALVESGRWWPTQQR